MKTEIINDYQKLKWKFFSDVNKKSIGYKGDIRAYIGQKTWLHERDSSESGPVQRHVLAFQSAVNDFSKIHSKEQFRQELSSALEYWRTEGKEIIRKNCKDAVLSPPVKEIKNWKNNGKNFISLFSGAFGLDLGFMAVGFRPLMALDIEESSYKTINTNLPRLPFINEDVNTVSTKRILEEVGLDVGGLDVVTGGPPCQPFSTAGKRQSMLDPRASPLREYVRFIKEARPKCFVMEEVEGILSARLKHVPIAERDDKRVLSADEQHGSAFRLVMQMLTETGYKISYNLVNAADYGAPQVRRRLIFIGLREGVPELPEPTHSYKPQLRIDGPSVAPWNTFWEATADLQGTKMDYSKFSEKISGYMKNIPPGGYWRQLPEDMVLEAMGGAHESKGGKMGYYRRLSWDCPSPTVVTTPSQKGTLLCHPEGLRPITVEEYKRIQGFPDDWTIPGSTIVKYQLIGNAVPVYLSHAIAQQVLKLLDEN
jgi:DNA (cytosine-5)-methyltransferase 1